MKLAKIVKLLGDYDSLLGGMETENPFTTTGDQMDCRVAVLAIEKAEHLLKDALCVLNAHAVGRKTQEAIEKFLGDT